MGLCVCVCVCRYAVILAFDVKVERDSQEMADSLGVRIFSAEIIYHLFDAFTKYREDYKKQKQDEFKCATTFTVYKCSEIVQVENNFSCIICLYEDE